MDITISLSRFIRRPDNTHFYDGEALKKRVISLTDTLEKILSRCCDKYVFQVEQTYYAGQAGMWEPDDYEHVTEEMPRLWNHSSPCNPHIQARIVKKAKSRTLTFATWLSKELKNQGEPIELAAINVSPSSNIVNNFDYAMKDDTRWIGPFSDRNVEAYKVSDPLKGLELYEWQNFIENSWFSPKNEYNVNGRKILFVVNPEGGCGKTTFVKHMLLTRERDVCVLPVTGTPTQMATALVNLGPYPNYILDLPRVKPSDQKWLNDMMYVLEQLQNGIITTSMYGKYDRLVMKNPNICVFSNWKLDESLSLDRYLYLYPNDPEKTSWWKNVPDVPGELNKEKVEQAWDAFYKNQPSRIGAQDVGP